MVISTARVIYGVLAIGSVALFVVINTTDPTESVASILLVFLLLYVVLTCVLYLVSRMVVGLIDARKRAAGGSEGARSSVSEKRIYYVASAVAFAPVCLLAMQSLNQVRVLDLLLVFALTALVVFYVIRRTA